jgi:tRNA A-37 threonylcarbamoyl transferase component Bud32
MAPTLQTLATLQSCGRSIPLPFRLALPDGSELLCTALLRLLPGKRLVLRATHGGRTILAKLFFAERNRQQELDGYALLQETGVPTPALLAQHRIGSGGTCLYEYIDNATALDSLWQQSRSDTKAQLLGQLLPLLQQCHAQHVLQQDLHLGNFLLAGETLYVLDPASCQRTTDAAAVPTNLALLLAQLPFTDWPLALQAITAAYPALDSHTLASAAQALARQRQRAYLQKILRDCSDVADCSEPGLHLLCRRECASDTLLARLREPARLADGATMLKNGNSAKVFCIDIDGRALVVKQYINKDWLRQLRRAFRPSRALRSWRIAHAFAAAGIRVPAPVAVVEQKSGPLVRSAWYVSEYTAGCDLLASWQQRGPSDGELEALYDLFLLLQHCDISHGDLKATNLLTDGEHITVIDYDGACEHQRAATLARALAADKQRLLQNWTDQPALQQRLAKVIDA